MGNRKEEVEFPSEGATLRGRLYLPEGAPPYAAVAMAHGFTATIHMTADRYAERLRDTGLAVLLYDHRNLGASDGEPRQEVNPWIQGRGYRDAVSYLLSRQEIDRDRIALWGDSFSAMVVLVVGALDDRVKAVVAQIPSCGPQKPPVEPSPAMLAEMKEIFARGDVRGTPETTAGPMPVVSPDQQGMPSHLKPVSAFRWFIEYGGRFGSNWQNSAIRVAPPTKVPFSAYLAAPHIKADVLMLVAPGDEMVNANPAISRATYDLLKCHKEYVEIDGGHFGLLHYPGELFEKAAAAQCDFLARCLTSNVQPKRKSA
jgi:pimeloyl-ACP methyl ester carboxylesterase